MNYLRVFTFAAFAGIVPLISGCGHGHNLDRLPVHGAVTIADGERLDGSITFTPTSGQPGPSATAKIEDGKYRFNRNDGPTAGPHKVVVRTVVSRETMLKADAERQQTPQAGAEWTRETDLKDDGTYLQDFAL